MADTRERPQADQAAARARHDPVADAHHRAVDGRGLRARRPEAGGRGGAPDVGDPAALGEPGGRRGPRGDGSGRRRPDRPRGRGRRAEPSGAHRADRGPERPAGRPPARRGRALARQPGRGEQQHGRPGPARGPRRPGCDRAELNTGFAPVHGPGVRFTVDNRPGIDVDTEIRDEDLATLVDGLWAAGAEAIADQRPAAQRARRHPQHRPGGPRQRPARPRALRGVGDRRPPDRCRRACSRPARARRGSASSTASTSSTPRRMSTTSACRLPPSGRCVM